MVETVIVIAILAGAAAYLFFVIRRAIRTRRFGCACGRRGVCPALKMMQLDEEKRRSGPFQKPQGQNTRADERRG